MAWKTVYIVVEADSIDDAEQKALEVFETEGNDVSDGQFQLESGEEEIKTMRVKEIINNHFFLNVIQEQIKDYTENLNQLVGWNPKGFWSLKELRKSIIDYHPYLSSKITHKSVIYNGITYEPVLDVYDIPNDSYLVPIMFHY